YPRLYLSTDPNATTVRTARTLNASVPAHLVERAANLLGELNGLKAVVLGASYRTGVKETAFSGVFPVVEALRAHGAEVAVHDTYYDDAEIAEFGWDPYHLGEPADLAIVQTNHPEYRELTAAEVPGVKLLIDGRNITTAAHWKAAPRLVLGAGSTSTHQQAPEAGPGGRARSDPRAGADAGRQPHHHRPAAAGAGDRGDRLLAVRQARGQAAGGAPSADHRLRGVRGADRGVPGDAVAGGEPGGRRPWRGHAAVCDGAGAAGVPGPAGGPHQERREAHHLPRPPPLAGGGRAAGRVPSARARAARRRVSGLPALVAAAITVLAAAYLPGFAAVRLLGGSRWLALALAPALGAAVAGTAAIAAPLVGLRWSLLPFLLGAAVLLAVALGLRRLDVQLPATVLDGPLGPRPTVPFAGAWIAAAAGVAIAPIVYQAGRADAVLERWDTLYHLSALQRIRETGTASSLDLGSVSNSAGDPTPYPAGFHALASLVPGV